MKNIKILLLAAISIVACEKKEDIVVVPEVPITAGSANFSKYVAVGNSLTAGFSDGALFKAGQLGSWTNVLNEQFKLVEGAGKGTEFKIPFMPDNNIGGILAGPNVVQNPRVFWNGAGPSPAGSPTSQITDRAAGSGFNNMGVPGAKSFHLIAPGYGNLANLPAANPYFCRFASVPNARIIDDATAQNATFFSLWIGNNDVLSYALSGGTGTDQTGNPNFPAYGGDDITDPTVFDNVYKALVNGNPALGVVKGLATDANTKGVVCNIPYVTTIPMFTTVKFNAPKLVQAQVDALNGGYAAYNTALQNFKNGGLITEAERVQRTITFVVGQNPVVIIDKDLTTDLTSFNPALVKMRQAKSSELILLVSGGVSAQAHLGAGNGTQFPLADKWVLTDKENLKIKTAVDAYNVTIKNVAAANPRIAFVDTNKLLQSVALGGVSSNGYTVTNTYPTGGGFSLDGVHPCPRGYALITNEVIRVINEKFGSTLRPVDISKYRVQYPRVITN
jgi:hypothetical protein